MYTLRELYDEVAAKLGAEAVDAAIRRCLMRLRRKATPQRDGAPERIIADLNRRTGFGYECTDENRKRIGRLLQDYTEADIIAVHELMAGKWLHNATMKEHLAPQTLHRLSKFKIYLEKLTAQQKRRISASGGKRGW